VGSLRGAQHIAHARMQPPSHDFVQNATTRGKELLSLMQAWINENSATSTVQLYRDQFQKRMSQFGAHIRDPKTIAAALEEAYAQCQSVSQQKIANRQEIPLALQNKHLVLAHAAYLEAIRAYLERGGGSRGSYMVMDPQGLPVLDALGEAWRYKAELTELREHVLETRLNDNGRFSSEWRPRRPLPDELSWFETVWGKYLDGEIFQVQGDV
jgi:hypothetical protein